MKRISAFLEAAEPNLVPTLWLSKGVPHTQFSHTQQLTAELIFHPLKTDPKTDGNANRSGIHALSKAIMSSTQQKHEHR